MLKSEMYRFTHYWRRSIQKWSGSRSAEDVQYRNVQGHAPLKTLNTEMFRVRHNWRC